jgi:OmpA-OmpF porin, OOP family
MCNWKKWIWPGLVAVALLAALTGWFRSGQVETDLTARTMEQMKASQGWSGISFNGRDATLTGIAENAIQKAAAAKLALDTYGVRVVTDLTKLPEKANPFALSAIKDAAGVTLTGNYDTFASRAALLAAAAAAMPGIAITDKLTLASGKPDGFDALAGFGVGQLADLTSGEVDLSNLNYSIKGTPVDPGTYARVAAESSVMLPGNGALKLADLTVPTLGKPYEFSASYDGATVNLTGYAPSLESSAAIEAEAKRLFPNKTVVNALVLAAGASLDFANQTTFGLTQLASLENGAFSFKELNFDLKGTPVDAAAYESVTKAVKESLPAGVKLLSLNLIKPIAPVTVPVATAETIVPAPTPEAKQCLGSISELLSTGQINFEQAQSVIGSDSIPLLDKIVSILISCPDVKMVITGHTDTDGDDNANQALSSDRANAVKNYILNAGIANTRLSAIGYGEMQPLVANDSPENKAKNRRIEFRLVQ